jgi:type IV secretory pathway VirJ component
VFPIYESAFVTDLSASALRNSVVTTMIRPSAISLMVAFCCFAASCSHPVEGGRYGRVKIVQPGGPAKSLVILFSDRNGLTRADIAAAQSMAKNGALVAEIDSPQYLSRLDTSHEKCHDVETDVDWLSRGLQRKYRFANYFTPIVAGTGEGGTLAAMALAEAPAATIAGAVSLNPSALIRSRRPICTGLPIAGGPGGFRYTSPKQLPGFWAAGLTPAVSQPNRAYVLAALHSGAQIQVREFAASTNTADALSELIQPYLAKAEANATKLAALPLSVLPVEHRTKVIAVVLSGDGGWRDLDKTIAQDLQRLGIPVVGWDSLRYFWRKRTPAQTAASMTAVLKTFMAEWDANQVALIGYSFGADVLPFIYNRLPPNLRSRVVLIALLGFAKSADFEIQVYGWLGLPPGPEALPEAPELAKIAPGLIQCFYGESESDTACPQLTPRGVQVIRTRGGHHFDGNYAVLADDILKGLKRRMAARITARLTQGTR